MIARRSPSELDKLNKAGLLVHKILQRLKEMVAVGVSTWDLETEADRIMRDAGAKPAFKGYYSQAAGTKYPYVLCVSVNEEIVHGMPSQKKILQAGDVVSLDTGVQLNGYYGDSALTVALDPVTPENEKLLRVTSECLDLAIKQAVAGNRLADISGAVERHAVTEGFSVVREFVGHGIGTSLHEEPQVPNYVDRKNDNPRLKEGMVLAIEPMILAGRPESKVLKDKWTAVTKDGRNAAHFEHMVAITNNGPWVLSRPA